MTVRNLFSIRQEWLGIGLCMLQGYLNWSRNIPLPSWSQATQKLVLTYKSIVLWLLIWIRIENKGGKKYNCFESSLVSKKQGWITKLYVCIGIETKFKNQLYPVIVATTHISELNNIEDCESGLRIGAGVTLATIDTVLKQKICSLPGL